MAYSKIQHLELEPCDRLEATVPAGRIGNVCGLKKTRLGYEPPLPPSAKGFWVGSRVTDHSAETLQLPWTLIASWQCYCYGSDG